MIADISTDIISQALFHTDPMHTCCKENDCFDEYDRVAEDIRERMQAGASCAHALVSALGAWFYDDEAELVGLEVIKPVIEWIERQSNTNKEE